MTEVRVVREFPRRVEVRERVLIPLADGTRLAARIWLPDDAEADPVPAVLEYLPYRLNDGTASGDHQQMGWFAGHGYAGVRVDLRGTGESDGVYLDEYAPQEQEDALEVIAWLAAQSWCTGAVGMMGYSWSGFNALQVAARRPPALKAIATALASDDRYADDVHYRGVHAWGRMTSTREAFVVTTTLDCYEGSSRAFARAWSFTIPRDHC